MANGMKTKPNRKSQRQGLDFLRRRPGNFRKTELATGMGFHEARVADLDGDGDMDILDKPYNWEAPRVDVWLQNGTGPRQQAGIEVRPLTVAPAAARTSTQPGK